MAVSSSLYKPIVYAQFNMKKVKDSIKAKKEDVEALIIEQLTYIGEQCVKTARESGSYNDITGNLRSSIGYVVTKEGKQVAYGAPVENPSGKEGASGKQGKSEGEALLKKLMLIYKHGLALIVVAGMNYAVYVEAVHGKDVLTSAELTRDRLVEKLLGKLFE